MNNTALDFRFDGRKLIGVSRHTRVEITIDDWTEIGVEICHNDHLRPTFSLVINRPTHNLRIPSDAQAFKALVDYFTCLDGFDWQPLVRARTNPSKAYSLCWLRPPLSTKNLPAAA